MVPQLRKRTEDGVKTVPHLFGHAIRVRETFSRWRKIRSSALVCNQFWAAFKENRGVLYGTRPNASTLYPRREKAWQGNPAQKSQRSGRAPVTIFFCAMAHEYHVPLPYTNSLQVVRIRIRSPHFRVSDTIQSPRQRLSPSRKPPISAELNQKIRIVPAIRPPFLKKKTGMAFATNPNCAQHPPPKGAVFFSVFKSAVFHLSCYLNASIGFLHPHIFFLLAPSRLCSWYPLWFSRLAALFRILRTPTGTFGIPILPQFLPVLPRAHPSSSFLSSFWFFFGALPVFFLSPFLQLPAGTLQFLLPFSHASLLVLLFPLTGFPR